MTRPAAVGAWALAGLAIALAQSDPVSRAVVLAAAWLLLVRRKVPDRRLRPLAVGLAVITATTVAVNGLLAHTGATVLAVVPSWVPLVGGVLTVEGFLAGGGIALGLAGAVSVVAALSLVLEPSDVVDALPGPLHRTAAAVGAALNLVPATAESFVEVRDAQRLRGWRPKGPSAVADLAVPVLLGAIERSVQLAESMEARAFGSGRRTTIVGLDRSRAAGAVGLGALAAVVLLVVGRATGSAGSWYAYPTPSAPSLSPLVLAPAVLLAVTGFLLPPSRS